MLWGGLELAVKGPDLGEDSLGKQSRRKSIVQPFRIFYSLPPGSPIRGAIAPPGRDAATCHKPTSHITSKKSPQKTAITGSTPSPSSPLPWLPRGHKSSAGTTDL